MANYYSVVHHTIRTRLDSSGGDPRDKKSPSALLERARTRLLGKLLAMNTESHGHLSFIPLEFTFGGKFPLDEYKGLVKSVARYVETLHFRQMNSFDMRIVFAIMYHFYPIQLEIIFTILMMLTRNGWRI